MLRHKLSVMCSADMQLPAMQDRYNAGLILEYVWHIVFGEPAVYHAPSQCELLTCDLVETA